MNKILNVFVVSLYLLPISINAQQQNLSKDNENLPRNALENVARTSNISGDAAQMSVSTENYLYTWKSKEGDFKGQQYVAPLNFSFQKGNFSAGLRTAYINSENKSPEQKGKVATWSDTSLTMAYTMFKDKAYPVRLNLATNLPTGKASLAGSEKNAIMDSNLVWQTRFGEGLNITPGISVSHTFNDKDTVGLGLSHIFRGEFDPNKDVENDRIKQGDDTIANLQYTHITKDGYVQSGLSYQHSGTTKRNGQPYYQKGDLWSAEVNGHLALTPTQSINAGYSFSYRNKDKYINNFTGNLEIEDFNSNGATHWANFGYTYAFKPNQSIGATVDFLKIKSNSYDQINALYMPARTKYGVGMSYNYKIKPEMQLSLTAKRFHMRDDATPYLPQQNYNGWNVLGSLRYQF